jgi:hypothetical protein
MLEKSIERFFQEIADQEQPQSRVSIQEALRDGRVRLRRRRRVRATGTPALAAVAVAAIAVSSIGLAGRHDAGQQQGGAASTARHFSALSPYATFGWLPAKEPVVPGHERDLARLGTGMGGVISWNLEDLSSGPWQLKVYAAGECHQAGSQLHCAKSLEQDPCALTREAPAPPVNGHQAFWLAGPGTRCLSWEYAPGGWASLWHYNEIRPDKRLVLRVASAIRFGGHQPLFKFAAQLRNLPGKWRVVFASFGVTHGVLQAGGFKITDGASATGVEIDMTPANAKHNRCERVHTKRSALLCRVINGYYVNYVQPPKLTTPSCPPGKICAPPVSFVHIWASDADGWNVDLMAGPQHFGLLFPVFEHLTIAGRNPATWTTKPIS